MPAEHSASWSLVRKLDIQIKIICTLLSDIRLPLLILRVKHIQLNDYFLVCCLAFVVCFCISSTI